MCKTGANAATPATSEIRTLSHARLRTPQVTVNSDHLTSWPLVRYRDDKTRTGRSFAYLLIKINECLPRLRHESNQGQLRKPAAGPDNSFSTWSALFLLQIRDELNLARCFKMTFEMFEVWRKIGLGKFDLDQPRR